MVLYPECDLIEDHMIEQCEDCYRYYICKGFHKNGVEKNAEVKTD